MTIIFYFSGSTIHAWIFSSELMEAMWKPQRYKFANAAVVLYAYLLSIPDCVCLLGIWGHPSSFDQMHLWLLHGQRLRMFASFP